MVLECAGTFHGLSPALDLLVVPDGATRNRARRRRCWGSNGVVKGVVVMILASRHFFFVGPVCFIALFRSRWHWDHASSERALSSLRHSATKSATKSGGRSSLICQFQVLSSNPSHMATAPHDCVLFVTGHWVQDGGEGGGVGCE